MVAKYFWNIVLWLDQGLNALTGGDPAERLSSRAGKAQNKGKRWACILCRFLSVAQKDHCQKSINPNVGSNAVIPD